MTLWTPLTPVINHYIFGFAQPIPNRFNGSGDTLFLWTAFAGMLVVSLIIALIWSSTDHPRRYDPVVYRVCRVVMRYVLGSTLLYYGLSKIFHEQMPAPSVGRLLEPYGQSSPMGLLWTFVGFSGPFSAFVGFSEAIPALMLFFRRTTHLGALILATVMLNVFVMNLCFDVPVKLYSGQLLIMALFLAAHDFKRMWTVFILNRASEPIILRDPWRLRWIHYLGIICKLVILGMLAQRLYLSAQRMAKVEGAPLRDLNGYYAVDSFTADNIVHEPLVNDSVRWRGIEFTPYGYAVLSTMTERHRGFKIDGINAGHLTLETQSEKPEKIDFVYTIIAPAALQLEGRFEGNLLSIKLHSVRPESFPLMSRGFHWINEYPANR